MSNVLLSARSSVFERADPYAVSEYVNQHVGAHCIRLPTSGFPEASLNPVSYTHLTLPTTPYV